MLKRIIVASALVVAGAAHADTQLEARVKALETKVKKLEDDNARYAEALQFLEKVYQQQKAMQAAQDRDEPARDAMFAVPIADDVANGQVAGASGAAVTIVWAFDLADPYSARMVPVLDDLLDVYKGKLRVVFKHMIVHPQLVIKAHSAACAAGKQHKFVEYWHTIWKDGYAKYVSLDYASRDPALFDESHLATYAKTAGLDVKKFKADMASPACESLVKTDMKQLATFHVDATPTFFVNGFELSGAMPKEQLQRAIEERLDAQAASGVAAAKYYDSVVMAMGEKQFKSKAP